MSSVLIVLPILTILMFDLGLTLELKDFKILAKNPKPVLGGLIGQIIILPLLAFILAIVFHLEPLFFVGLVLVACSPGGSSSNVFSALAKGDVALSVTLTAISSVLTLFTIPVIMYFVSIHVGNSGTTISLPIGKLIVQNVVLTLVPVLIGIAINNYYAKAAGKIHKVLSKLAFPALILLATIFFVAHKETIISEFGKLGLCISILILLAMGSGLLISIILRLNKKEKRTILIEVGMQNAAQAIAIASSPFVFNNEIIAIPAIIYALMMNVILLSYVGLMKK